MNDPVPFLDLVAFDDTEPEAMMPVVVCLETGKIHDGGSQMINTGKERERTDDVIDESIPLDVIDDVVAGLGVGSVDVESVVTVEGCAEDGFFDFLISMVVNPDVHILASAEGISSFALSV